MPWPNLFGCGCCSGGGGDTVTVAGCGTCAIPRTLTLSWSYDGYAENPCSGGPHGLHGTYGPLTATLVYDDTVTGNWFSPWKLGPCWTFGDSEFAGQVYAPFGCLYQRFIFNCRNLTLNLYLSTGPDGPATTDCNQGQPGPNSVFNQLDAGQSSANLCPISLTYTGGGSSLFNHGILTA